MATKMSLRATSRVRNLRQAYTLLILGALCLLLAWLWHPAIPLGVLVLGLGMTIATVVNPYRLATASCLLLPLGLAVFLAFHHNLPGSQVFPIYIIAIGIGLLGCALMGRRGYIGRGPVTPALIVLAIGIIEYLLIANDTPQNFIPFMLSFWLPGLGLLLLGILYLLASFRT
jgi:hypothetical protein